MIVDIWPICAFLKNINETDPHKVKDEKNLCNNKKLNAPVIN